MKDSPAKEKLKKAVAALLALLVWQAASMMLGSPLLPAPARVAVRLVEIAGEGGYWRSMGFSLCHIALGFLAALLTGCALAALSGRLPLFETLLAPYMAAIKSVPVASFIILALMWLPSRLLSAFIAFLMVLPVIYANVLNGVRSVDVGMLEAAEVFRVPWGQRVLYMWLPAVKPYLFSSCSVALGLCWKAGVAAEVIGVLTGSIGEALYQAKIYYSMADLFAWTVTIVLLSAGFERLFMAGLRLAFAGLERRL